MPTFCYACETLRSEDENALFKEPCPKCGHTMTVSYPPGQEFKLVAGGFRITSRAPGGGKWFSDQCIYHSHYKKDDEHRAHLRVGGAPKLHLKQCLEGAVDPGQPEV
jgi:hypothetical protein